MTHQAKAANDRSCALLQLQCRNLTVGLPPSVTVASTTTYNFDCPTAKGISPFHLLPETMLAPVFLLELFDELLVRGEPGVI